MYKKGSNQHKAKHKYWMNIYPETWKSIIFICFLAFCIIPQISNSNKIISPCAEECKVITTAPKKVYATDELDDIERLFVLAKRTFGAEHISAFTSLIYKESSFNKRAVNPSSGSCGWFQAYPCEKMNCSLDDADCQMEWGFNYIKVRYGTPTKAWEFWKRNGWY